MSFVTAYEYETYDQVPFYRKRWFFVCSVLFFMPLAIILSFTGDIYLLQNSTVKRYQEGHRILIGIALLVLIIFNIFRFTM